MEILNNPPEIDRIYWFQREVNGVVERIKYMRSGSSAQIKGRFAGVFDQNRESWKDALQFIEKHGFVFDKAGRFIRVADFLDGGEETLEAWRAWAHAVEAEEYS